MKNYVSIYTDIFKASKSCKFRVFVEKIDENYFCRISKDSLIEKDNFIVRVNANCYFNTPVLGSFSDKESAEEFIENIKSLNICLENFYNKTISDKNKSTFVVIDNPSTYLEQGRNKFVYDSGKCVYLFENIKGGRLY